MTGGLVMAVPANLKALDDKMPGSRGLSGTFVMAVH